MATCARAEIADFEEGRPWAEALLWTVMLAVFFFSSYGFANWVTSRREHVPALVFDWEHRIPFLAWTIIPYWSTDLLYAASLFLCRTRKELHTHVQRLTTAQVISVSAFLLFPLRFTFERPHPAGLFGWMFDALASFDQPFNQAPSLHLCLTTILWAKYAQHLSGGPLRLMRGWLILTGISTLTTYQHHFIDLPTGIWVGLFCLALFPSDPEARQLVAVRDSRRIRIGVVYLAGSVLLVGLAAAVSGAAWWLLWPAGSLAVVGAVYFIGRPDLFQKANGEMPPAIVGLLAPYLGMAWLNTRLWTWNAGAANEIVEDVWLGRVHGETELLARRFRSIVDLNAELPVPTAGLAYRAVPMLDLLPPAVEQLHAAVEAIQESERPTLVCCALGYSRSAAAVAAWLVASGRSSSMEGAISQITARRPQIALGAAHRARLKDWFCRRGGG